MFKKICLLILSVFFSFIAFELFLRFSPFSNGVSPVKYDKDIGMWHKNDFSNYIIKECYKTKYKFDELGRVHNNYEYKPYKKDIILLGDSQIEALMVENKNILHNRLYEELHKKYNVLNFGLSGTGPSQHFEILKRKVIFKNLNYVLHFIFLENDLDDGNPNNFNGSNRPKVFLKFENLDQFKVIKPKPYDLKEKVRDFLGNFELYIYLKKTYYFYSSLIISNLNNQKYHKTKVHKIEERPLIDKNKWMQLKGAIHQVNKMLTSKEVNYRIVFLSSSQFNNSTIYTNLFEKFLKEEDIDYLNIYPFLNNLKKEQQIDYKCDTHWNGFTHSKLAKYIVSKEFIE